MVHRKPPPPRLENLTKWHARSEPRSPASPPRSSPSSQGRVHLNRLPSQESVYSPDLNTSPAFDLMTLEEAQRSSMGSATSQPPSSWPDSLGEQPLGDRPGTGGSYHAERDHDVQGIPSDLVPSPQKTETADGGSRNTYVHHTEATAGAPVQLQSNNPFLRPRPELLGQDSTEQSEGDVRYSHATTSSGPLSQTEGYIPMTARLSLLDSSEPQDRKEEDSQLWPLDQTVVEQFHGTSLQGSQHSIKVSARQDIYLQGGQANSYAPAVVVETSDAHLEDPLGPPPSHAQAKLGSDAGSQSRPASFGGASAASHALIDLDGPDTLTVEPGPHRASSSVYSSEAEAKGEKVPVDDTAPRPESSFLQTNAGPTEQKSPTSSNVLSPAEAARQKEQRAEAYSVRRINWTDRAGQLLQSPILVQNQNGPCPLLALINALVLRADPKTQPPIVRALHTREHISLGLLIEALFEELTTCLGPDEEFPDIEALTQFLTMLHTGMNVNPRLVLETTTALGTFLQTADIQLYSTFGVPLTHGWLASWSSPEHAAMTRIAQYHEDIQLLPFRKQELEDRVMQGQSLSPEEEQRMADIQTIQQFVEIDTATQLSPFGLTQLTTHLEPGSVSIFFRNDHFSTLYKHPKTHQLYTLVTDAGYANHAEVVWESLVDVTGFDSEFLSGDFRTVSHGPTGSARPNHSTTPAGPHASSTAAPNTAAGSDVPKVRLSSQEQSDADYAYALSLQYQEEAQRERTNNSQEQAPVRHTSVPVRTSGSAPRMTNAPIRNSSIATSGARLNQSHNEANADDPNAPPPPYEQAARGPRYSPPVRRRMPPDSGPNPQYSPNRYPREQAQYRPVSNRHGSDRGRTSKDCIVM